MPRGRESRQILPITGHEIIDFFSSENFVDALAKTANYTHRTGYESGILAERGIHDNKVKVTELQFGRSEGLEGGIAKPMYEGREHREVGSTTPWHYHFLRFHFHPEARGPPIPSGYDLFSAWDSPPILAGVVEWDVRSVEGVAQVDERWEVQMVLYQVNDGVEIPIEYAEETSEELSRAVFLEDVARRLRESGYFEATFLRYSKKGSRYLPNEEDLRGLDVFAYSPKVEVKSWWDIE